MKTLGRVLITTVIGLVCFTVGAITANACNSMIGSNYGVRTGSQIRNSNDCHGSDDPDNPGAIGVCETDFCEGLCDSDWSMLQFCVNIDYANVYPGCIPCSLHDQGFQP